MNVAGLGAVDAHIQRTLEAKAEHLHTAAPSAKALRAAKAWAKHAIEQHDSDAHWARTPSDRKTNSDAAEHIRTLLAVAEEGAAGATDDAAAVLVADSVIARSMDYDGIREMLIDAARRSPVRPNVDPSCNGLCVTAAAIGVGSDSQVAYGHPDCDRHGHLGSLEAAMFRLTEAQARLGRARAHHEEHPDSAGALFSSDAAADDRDDAIRDVTAQVLRGKLFLSPDLDATSLVEPLVERARRLHPDAAEADVRAGVQEVLVALGMNVRGR